MNINEMISKNMEYRNHMIRKAKPIVDLDIIDCIKETDYIKITSDLPIAFNTYEFFKAHMNWVNSCENFKIHNLHNMTPLITNGVTDAFNDFYFLNNNIHVMQGEYTYHRDLGFKVLEDIENIEPNSALIISYPFSATGNVHKYWNKIIDVCEKMNINVFVDCCLFGISKVDDLDTSKRCITHVAFSFSKTFSTAGNRTGVLYTCDNRFTPIRNQNAHFYTNMMGQIMHHKLMMNFSPDYIFNKYRSKQLKLCNTNSLNPSDTVIFGISDDKRFDHFERDNYTNRICLSYALQEFNKPLEL